MIQLFTKEASHIISYGYPGTGKSVNTRFLTEEFLRKGHKIIDLYDEGRLENCFIAFPNPDDKWMNDKFSQWIGKPFTQEIKGYPTECYIPITPNLPKTLPSIFKPFRILFSDLTRNEFIILLGKLAPPQMELVSMIWDYSKVNKSFDDIINITNDFMTDSKIRVNKKVIDICDDKLGLSLLRKIDRLHTLGIISSSPKDQFNLKLNKIMEDQKTVTCFSFAFMEDQNIRHLLWGYLFRKIFTMRIQRLYRQYPPLAIIHRELQNNAPARGKRSYLSYEGQTLSLEFLKRIIAEPRDIKVRIIADSQDPMKIDTDVRKGFKTRFIFQMDRAVLDAITKQFYLPDKVYIGIQYLETGQFAVKSLSQRNNPLNRKGIQFPCMNPPPQSWCKSPDDLFFKIWKKLDLPFNDWKFDKTTSLISIKKISKKDKEEITMKTASLYEFYGRLISMIIRENPGILTTQIIKHPTIKEMGWDKAKIYRTINHLANKEPPEITREKSGTAWKCYPI